MQMALSRYSVNGKFKGSVHTRPDYYRPPTKKERKKERKENEMTEQWICTVCGYVYDGDIPFEELPDDYVCPICGEPKSVFVKQEA